MKACATFTLAPLGLTLALLVAAPAARAAAPHDPPARPRQAAPAPKPGCCGTAATAKAPAPAAPMLAVNANDPTTTAGSATPASVQVRGVVVLPDGRPCAGASVFPALNPRALTVTDAQGAFTLTVPAGKPLSLKVDLLGEGSSYLRVPAPPAEPLHITLGQ